MIKSKEQSKEVKRLEADKQSLQSLVDMYAASAQNMSNDSYRKIFCREFVTRHDGYILVPDGRGGWNRSPLSPKQLWQEARYAWDAKPEDL